MKEPICKATHIVKQFGPTIALNDVDIAIYPGEIRGFIGENGSGKSTMSAIMTVPMNFWKLFSFLSQSIMGTIAA